MPEKLLLNSRRFHAQEYPQSNRYPRVLFVQRIRHRSGARRRSPPFAISDSTNFSATPNVSRGSKTRSYRYRHAQWRQRNKSAAGF
jgi:hypothetical protein